MSTTDSPKVLLVEDNPGDARYIRELLKEATEVSERILVGAAEAESTADGGVSLVHETRLADGLDRLAEGDWSAVLLDLNLPDSTGLDTLSTVTEADETVPVVVLTGVSDRQTGLEALRRGAEEYLVKDEINADVLARSVVHAIERKESELRLERQRERLAALNHLNRVVHGVTGAVIEQSTRQEIERITCERLASSTSYAFAWIGERDPATETVEVRASAGGEAYLENISISTDPDDPESQGPTGRALRTGEVTSISDIREDPDYDPWVDTALEHGVRSSVAIPIVHEESIYGALNVYADRTGAFRDEERAVLRQLGEIVGHAIAAADRKQALMSDSVVELELRVRNVLESLNGPDALDGEIRVERLLPVAGDEFVAYVTTAADNDGVIDDPEGRMPNWKGARRIGDEGDAARFEVQLSDAPLAGRITSLGGSVEEMVLEGRDARLTVHLPQGVKVRRVVESVRERFPDTEPVARRQVTDPDESTAGTGSVSLGQLTDRQRTVLETAYFSGYFEWPRETSGEEVAEMLDISPATFSQHLRTAQRKCFEGILDDDAETPDPPA